MLHVMLMHFMVQICRAIVPKADKACQPAWGIIWYRNCCDYWIRVEFAGTSMADKHVDRCIGGAIGRVAHTVALEHGARARVRVHMAEPGHIHLHAQTRLAS